MVESFQFEDPHKSNEHNTTNMDSKEEMFNRI